MPFSYVHLRMLAAMPSSTVFFFFLSSPVDTMVIQTENNKLDHTRYSTSRIPLMFVQQSLH